MDPRALLFTAVLVACQGAPKDEAPVKITISGSTALSPLLTEAASRYMKDHKNVAVEVSSVGSLIGLAKLEAGEVTIGSSDVPAEGPAASSLVDHRIAVVGFATMANQGPFNDAVTSLTKDEVVDVFTGKFKNWNELGGSDQPIFLVNRAKGSGTRAAFGSLALGGDRFGTAFELESNSQIQSKLLQTPGAVSYLALSYRHPSLKVFAYEGVAPTTENITSGMYSLWAYEHLYTRGPPSPEAAAFITFITSGRFQREALPPLGFIPIHDMRVVSDQGH